MKKARKTHSLTFLLIFVAAMLMFGECGDSASTTETTVTAVVEAEPTAVPTEAPAEPTIAPTEEVVEATPTEAIVEDNPNIIDGVDFTKYHNREQSLDELFYTINYDTLRLAAIKEKTAEAFLKDGDHFEMIKEDDADTGEYSLYVYSPKRIREIKKGDNLNAAPSFSEEKYMDKLSYWIRVKDEVVGEDMETWFTATYEDGTEETITVYITKDYVVE